MLFWPIIFALGAQAAPQEVVTIVGEVRLTKGSVAPITTVFSDTESFRLTGDLADELAHLQATKLEIIGHLEAGILRVEAYRILDIGGGLKPLVGFLVETQTGLGLKDGEGQPIDLVFSAKTTPKLRQKIGAKIWVYGKKLISGELKVLRYGILREVKNDSHSEKGQAVAHPAAEDY